MNRISATGSSNTTGTTRKLGVVGLSALLLALVALNQSLVAGEAGTDIDDGWRRTKDGWEHISTWPVEVTQQLAADESPTTSAQISPTAERWQRLHPGVLAVGLCLAACFALRIPRASTSS